MKFLLDTDTCIYALKQNRAVLNRCASLGWAQFRQKNRTIK